MYTSCFSRLRTITANTPPLYPVAISHGVPPWFQGSREWRLTPTPAMRTMPMPEMVAAYRDHLATLDPSQLAADLGEQAVLLCWEPPGIACHRRIVAEWLEAGLGAEVLELGFPRALIPRFDDAPPKGTPISDLPWEADCDHCHATQRVALDMRECRCVRCNRLFHTEW